MPDLTDNLPPVVARDTLEELINNRATADAAFRAALLSDPKQALSALFARPLPTDLNIAVVAEDERTFYYVIPNPDFFGGETFNSPSTLDPRPNFQSRLTHLVTDTGGDAANAEASAAAAEAAEAAANTAEDTADTSAHAAVSAVSQTTQAALGASLAAVGAVTTAVAVATAAAAQAAQAAAEALPTGSQDDLDAAATRSTALATAAQASAAAEGAIQALQATTAAIAAQDTQATYAASQAAADAAVVAISSWAQIAATETLQTAAQNAQNALNAAQAALTTGLAQAIADIATAAGQPAVYSAEATAYFTTAQSVVQQLGQVAEATATNTSVATTVQALVNVATATVSATLETNDALTTASTQAATAAQNAANSATTALQAVNSALATLAHLPTATADQIAANAQTAADAAQSTAALVGPAVAALAQAAADATAADVAEADAEDAAEVAEADANAAFQADFAATPVDALNDALQAEMPFTTEAATTQWQTAVQNASDTAIAAAQAATTAAQASAAANADPSDTDLAQTATTAAQTAATAQQAAAQAIADLQAAATEISGETVDLNDLQTSPAFSAWQNAIQAYTSALATASAAAAAATADPTDEDLAEAAQEAADAATAAQQTATQATLALQGWVAQLVGLSFTILNEITDNTLYLVLPYAPNDSAFMGPYSVAFDGATSTLQTEATLPPASQVAVEVWFNLPEFRPDQQDILAAFSDGASGWQLQVGGGLPCFTVWLAGTAYSAQKTGQPLSANAWHYVAGVYDGAEVRLYCDGAWVTATPTPATGVITPYPGPLVLGGDAAGSANAFFLGLIHQFRLWGTALTTEQVQSQRFKRRALTALPTPPSTEALLVNYEFTEGTGVAAADSSPNFFTGFLRNATWQNTGLDSPP